MSNDTRTETAPHFDDLGCPLSKLNRDNSALAANIKFLQKGSSSQQLGQVRTPACDRGYLIGVSTTGGHRRVIHDGRRRSEQIFAAGSVYSRSFAQDYKADISGAFDFNLMEIGMGGLERIAAGADAAGIHGLKQGQWDHDPVLFGLTRALFCAQSDSKTGNALLINQLSTAIGIHLVRQYGEGRITSHIATQRLSRESCDRVVDMMACDLAGSVSIEDLANACSLSPRVFLKAFRDSTGRTPSQRHRELRIEKACDLLLHTDMPLKGIAHACGFTDQSHFTRHFSRDKGLSPGQWRRRQRL
ncbi:AraC family transcriptional regulator [Breoghania sp. JC706]|uniref:AraC family transcriptional regulator n=1 Tax=Breoghania sp. JC706 TaxID=3117732 RepID=UPI00300A2A0C